MNPASFQHRVAGSSGRVIDLATAFQSGRRPRRPFVLVNMAMTADGKIATANRAVSSFGSPRDGAHLYELRATADAVMCGARTVDAEDVHLGPGGAKYQRRRRRAGLAEFNARVLVSGAGSVNLAAPLFNQRFSPIIVLTSARAGERRIRAMAEVADEVVVGGGAELDLPAALAWLRARWGVRRLVCEGGGELNAAMFTAGLVDELHLTICPFVVGGRTAPTIAEGQGIGRLAAAVQLSLKSRRRVADELFCVFTVQSAPKRRSVRRAVSGGGRGG